MNKNKIWSNLRFLLVVVLLGVAAGSRAEDEATPAEVLKEAMKAMEAGKFDDAAASMYMYLGMVEESKAPRVIAIAQDIRFKLGTMLIKAERLEEAAAVLQEYIDRPLAEHPRQAMKMLATCYFEIEAYEECVTACTNALYYNENPVIEARKVVKGDDDEEKFQALDDKEPEPDYTQEELTMLNMTLAESYYHLEKWEECIDPYSYVIQHTPSDQRKGYAIMQVINALIEIPAFDRILEWVPQLYRTDARFDIRVNLALMHAAAALYEAGEYDSALPLYRMILPRDELVTYQEGKVREMRVAFGLPPEEGAELTADDILLFGADEEKEATTEEKNAETGLLDTKPKELVELENLIIALKDLPPYELDIQYRMADLYKTVERHWEGLRFFDIVFSADPESEVGERSIYEIIDTLIEPLDEIKEAEERGFDYMGKYPKGMTPRQIAYMITGYHQKHEDWPALKPLKPYLDGFTRTNDETIVKYDVELYFMQAVADLVLQKYEDSEKSFKFILDEFPGSHQEANCIYWYGMSQMFLQKYVDAQPNFERYIKQFPTEQFVDECNFQVGICLFGQEKYKEAHDRFSYVIDTYPDSSIYPEACSMRGDIYGAGEVYAENDYLDRALADYDRAYVASKKVNQATYATFQAADVYEAEDKYDEILRVVERYETDWGGNGADVAKALFWIGKTKIQQREYEAAVHTYVGAIAKYGGDLRQDGVDDMIAELVKISSIYLDTELQAKLKDDLNTALEETDNETLKLRLRVTLAKLDKTEIELGQQLLKELENLDNASPPVLACICDASFAKKDYSRAEELLRIFINKFEDSDYMRAAYKLRGYGQYAEKDFEGALQTINDAQALYGTEYDVAWAQLMKAQIRLDQGQIDGEEGARAANMNLLNVPSWRGAPVAQATFQLGQVEEAAGNLKKAFGFYQRAYFQYKGHSGGYWAAEGYLASARILEKLGAGYENDRRNTYRAMLFDRYVNELPQAEEAREVLGATEVAEIAAYVETGGVTNIAISVESEPEPETTTDAPAATEGGE
ncbi:tetratricopeptide repeat protein [Pontiella desulfatans]|uniref:tetratricopeptide repeat protein n=1 Tax=Pontiella desulfatans TaxID=2750659 RepID=UPI00144432B3|nr:tetratricopeptide repeat protein [Pontiella desulfatans]